LLRACTAGVAWQWMYMSQYVQLSFHFKFTLYSSQHGFIIKSKSTATSLPTYLNSITVSVSSQGQTDSIYFDLSQGADKVPHILLLHKLSNFGLYDRYINFFQSYLSPRFSVARTLGKYSLPFPMLSGSSQGSTLGPLFSKFLLMIYVPKFIFPNFCSLLMI
jgi:hypothetical protein